MELYSAENAEDTIEALITEQGPDRPVIFWILIFFLGAVLASLPIIKIDLSVRARGVVNLDAFYIGASGDEATSNDLSSVISIEAFLDEKDIKFLKIGQVCTLQYDAYPYTDWGIASGTVEQISNEPVVLGGHAFFKVIVQSSVVTLQLEDGRVGKIVNGMAAKLRFIVNRKSLLQLIYQKSETLFGT